MRPASECFRGGPDGKRRAGSRKGSSRRCYINEETKVSDAKGYKVKSVEKGGYVKDYLKTPKGKFYLGKKKLPW